MSWPFLDLEPALLHALQAHAAVASSSAGRQGAVKGLSMHHG